MLFSTIILLICLGLIVFETFSIVVLFRSCKNISCKVTSSKKVCVREEGCIVREYWKTAVDFTLNDTPRDAIIETSTFCQKGQVLSCYYYPERNLVFRKREIRSVLRAHSIQAFSVGVLFLVLTLMFRMTALGGIIITHTVELITVLLLMPFLGFGIGFIVYSVNALRHTRESKVAHIKAEVIDVVRKTKRHRENKLYLYYPIYKYSLNGSEHIVQSRLGQENMPEKGSSSEVLADLNKGGLVEYKDLDSSFLLGICFLIISALLLYTLIFP